MAQDQALRVEGTRGEVVRMTYFTDPVCSWCWAFEPAVLALNERFAGQIHMHAVPAGMVRDAGEWLDEGGRRLRWLRQHVAHVAELSGQPIDPGYLEHVGPGFSTWPACVAASAAGLQGLAEPFLRLLRLAVFTEQADLSDPTTLHAMARAVTGLDMRRFDDALADGSATQAFFAGRGGADEQRITGFPTVVAATEERRLRLVGHRDFDKLARELRHIAPWLEPREPRTAEELLQDHGILTSKELAVMMSTDLAGAEESAMEAGAGEMAVGPSSLWRLD